MAKDKIRQSGGISYEIAAFARVHRALARRHRQDLLLQLASARATLTILAALVVHAVELEARRRLEREQRRARLVLVDVLDDIGAAGIDTTDLVAMLGDEAPGLLPEE
jgi:hypothetical protein